MSKIKTKIKKNKKTNLKNITRKIGVTTLAIVGILPTVTPTFVLAATGTTATTSTGTTGGTLSGGTTDIQHRVWQTGTAQLHFDGVNQVVNIDNVFHHGEWYFQPRPGQTGTTTSGNSQINTVTRILIGNDPYDVKQNTALGNQYHAQGDSRNPAVHNTGGASLSCSDLSNYAPDTHVTLVSDLQFLLGQGGTGTGGMEHLETDLGTVKNMPCNWTVAHSINTGKWRVFYHSQGEAHSLTTAEITSLLDAVKEWSKLDPKYAQMTTKELESLLNDLTSGKSNNDLDKLKQVLHSKGFDVINSLAKTSSGNTVGTGTTTTYNGQTLTNEQASAVTTYEQVKASKDASAVQIATDALTKVGITDLTKLVTSTNTNQGTSTGTGTTTTTASTTQTNIALANVIKATQAMLGDSHTIGDLTKTSTTTNTQTNTKVSTETQLNAGTTRTNKLDINYVTKTSRSDKNPTFKHDDKHAGVCVLCGTSEAIVDSLANQQNKVISSEQMLQNEGGVLLNLNNKITSVEDVKKYQNEIQEKIILAEKLGSKNPYERQELLDKNNKIVKLYYLVGFDNKEQQLWVEAKSTWNNRLPENSQFKTVILGQSKSVSKTTITLNKQSQEDLKKVKEADATLQPIINNLVKAGITDKDNINDIVNKFINTITSTTTTQNNVVDGSEKYAFNGKELTPEQLQLFKQLQTLQSNPLSDKTQITAITNQLINLGINKPSEIKLSTVGVPTLNKEQLIKTLEELKNNADKIKPLIPNSAYNDYINKLNNVLTLLKSNNIPANKVLQLKNDLINILSNTFSWSSEFKTDITLYIVESEKIKSELNYNMQKDVVREDKQEGDIHYSTVDHDKTSDDKRNEYKNEVQQNIDANVDKFNAEYKDITSKLDNQGMKNQVLEFLKQAWAEYHNDQPKLDEILNALKNAQGTDLDKLLSSKPQLLAQASSILGSLKEQKLQGTTTSQTGTNHPNSLHVNQTPDVTKIQGAYFGSDSEQAQKDKELIQKAIDELAKQGKVLTFEGLKSTGTDKAGQDATFSASGTVEGQGYHDDVSATHQVQPLHTSQPDSTITSDYEIHSHISDDVEKLEHDFNFLKDAIQTLISHGGQNHQITKHLDGTGDITLTLNNDGTISSHFTDSTIKPTMQVIVPAGTSQASNNANTGTYNNVPLTTQQLPVVNQYQTALHSGDKKQIDELVKQLASLGITDLSKLVLPTTTSNTNTTSIPSSTSKTEDLKVFHIPGKPEIYGFYNGKYYPIVNGSLDTTKELNTDEVKTLIPINETSTKTLTKEEMDKLNDDNNKNGVVISELETEHYQIGEKSEAQFKTNGNLTGTVGAMRSTNSGIEANYNLNDEGFSLEETPEEVTIMVSDKEPELIKSIEKITGKKINKLWYDDLNNADVVKLIDEKLGNNTVESILASRSHEQSSDNTPINNLVDKLFNFEKGLANEKFTLSKEQLQDIKSKSKNTKDFENNVLDILNAHKFNSKSGFVSILGKYDDNCIKHNFIDTKHIDENKIIGTFNNSVRGSIQKNSQQLTLALLVAGTIGSLLFAFKDKLRGVFVKKQK